MKKVFTLIFPLILFGCSNNTAPIESQNTQNNSQDQVGLSEVKAVKQVPIKTVGLGKTCGGSENIGCKTGLICQLTQGVEGICIEAVVQKNLTCSKERKPVCGERHGIKNGYLNECEAIRHGATIINQGLCK